MGVVVEYPINLHVDNNESIFQSENTLVSQCTKHIDVLHYFIYDHVEYGTLKM